MLPHCRLSFLHQFLRRYLIHYILLSPPVIQKQQRPVLRPVRATLDTIFHFFKSPYPLQPGQLLQADFTHIQVEGYGTYYVCDLIDYFSKYTLVTLWSDRHNAETLIDACNAALREAQNLGIAIPDRIKLLTDNGPAMISQRFATYIKNSPFVHLRTGNHHPETNGCI